MAYFLKVSKQQTRTYLAIYESFYSPDVKGTKHRSVKNLGNINKLIDAGIDDPISFYQKEVDRMNAEKKKKSKRKPKNLFPIFLLKNILAISLWLIFLIIWTLNSTLTSYSPTGIFSSTSLIFFHRLYLPELLLPILNTGLFMMFFLHCSRK